MRRYGVRLYGTDPEHMPSARRRYAKWTPERFSGVWDGAFLQWPSIGDIKSKLQQRARRHGRSTEEEVREILRNAVWNDTQRTEPLGKRLRALFGEIGLEEDIPEWRGHPAAPATF